MYLKNLKKFMFRKAALELSVKSTKLSVHIPLVRDLTH